MVHIKVKKGLDIPIEGAPQGESATLTTSYPIPLALSLHEFPLKFHLLAKPGDFVKTGQPLAEDKDCPGRMFVSPATGKVKDILRGEKRVLKYMVVESQGSDDFFAFPTIDIKNSSLEELLALMNSGGIFSKIRARPFGLLADARKKPKEIFIKAIETAPFTPPAELQVAGYEKEFEAGIKALNKIAPGHVHLVFKQGSPCKSFYEAKDVHLHTVEGPHPAANPSLHIQAIAPLLSQDDIVWSLTAHDVTCLGRLITEGKVRVSRIVGVGGPGIVKGRALFLKLRDGFPVSPLIANRLEKSPARLISGDPLMGLEVKADEFLGSNISVFSVIPENRSREFLHFFRIGLDKYSFSRAYLSGHTSSPKLYPLTTHQHGEERAFIDSTLIDKVQPLSISTMHLVKSLLAEDYDTAVQLGLLEVVPEDFALPSFVCPSKIDMVDIVGQGLSRYAKDLLA